MMRIKICGLRREEDVLGVNHFDINVLVCLCK